MMEYPDELAFLVGSPRRIAVLDALRQNPRHRETLEENLDVSRTTVWRMLREFEEYEWVDRSNGQVVLTSKGQLVADAVDDLQSRLRAIEHLDELVEHIPIEEMDIGVKAFEDAEIARPEAADPTAPMRRAFQQTMAAERIRVLSQSLAPPVLEAMHERVLAGEQSVEMVVSPSVLEVIKSDPTASGQLEELLASPDATVYQYDHDLPFLLGILDDEIGMGVIDETGQPLATIRTSDERVLEWAEATYERFRDQSEPISEIS